METEIDSAIKSVLKSTAFIKGPEVKVFEEALQSYLSASMLSHVQTEPMPSK